MIFYLFTKDHQCVQAAKYFKNTVKPQAPQPLTKQEIARSWLHKR
jgi:hypothetical protein